MKDVLEFLRKHPEHKDEYYITMIYGLIPLYSELLDLAEVTAKRLEEAQFRCGAVKEILKEAMIAERTLHTKHEDLERKFLKAKR